MAYTYFSLIGVKEELITQGGGHELGLRCFLGLSNYGWLKNSLRTGMLSDSHDFHGCLHESGDQGLWWCCQVSEPCSDTMAQEDLYYCMVKWKHIPVHTNMDLPQQFVIRVDAWCMVMDDHWVSDPQDLGLNTISPVFLCWGWDHVCHTTVHSSGW